MKTLLAAALIAALVPGLARADSLKCSSATGELQYSLTSEIPGGAAPPIGRASYGPTIKWFVNGRELPANAATLNPRRPDQVVRTAKVSQDLIEVYWTTASLGSRNYYVICESRRYTGPLPPAAAHR